MNKKNISILATLALSSVFSVGCSMIPKETKNESNETTTQTQISNENTQEIKITDIEKVSFESLSELKNFSKKSTSDFSKFLTANKIENVLAADGSIAINKNMTYEKYTKDFNQLAYVHISNNYEEGVGYLKSGAKVNFHLEETVSTKSNNFIKMIFTIINYYNPTITEKAFNEELAKATSDPTVHSDYSFNLRAKGITLNVYSKPDINERELVLSIRQELEFPKTEEFIKEYKTVKEFKEDSAKLSEDIKKKVSLLNDNLKNAYTGKSKSIEIKANDVSWNESTNFAQSFDIEYNAKSIDGIPDTLINGLYEYIETLFSKEKLSKIISSDDLKSYLKSLEIYSGLRTTGTLIDETGEAIQINPLPIPSGLIDLNIGFSLAESGANSETDDNSASIKKYNQHIKIKVNIPVKAEGITSL